MRIFICLLFGHCCSLFIDGFLFSDDGKDLFSPAEDSNSYVIPAPTVRILSYDANNYAFSICTNLSFVNFDLATELTYIGPYSFFRTKLTTLNLSACKKLERIDQAAFRECYSLQSIILNEGLLRIDAGGFSKTGIKSVYIPSSVIMLLYTDPLSGAFGYCSSLSEVIFAPNSSLTTMVYFTFQSSKINSVTLPRSLSSLTNPFRNSPIYQVFIDPENEGLIVENGVVMNKLKTRIYFSVKNITSFVMPDSITSIANSAFTSSDLSHIVFSSNLQTCENHAFSSTKLQSIELPASLRGTGYNLFGGCTSLVNVSFLGNNITTLGGAMFSGCNNLRSFIIPNGVTTIGTQCFSSCTNLDYLFVPDSVTTVYGNAFSGINVSEVLVFGENASLVFHNNVLYNKQFTSASLYIGPSSGEIVNIVASCATLISSLFYGKNIKGVIFDEGSKLNIIEESAFRQSKIENIILPNSTFVISKYAFEKCTNLHSIGFGSNLSIIHEYAFYQCTSLTSIRLPSSLTQIKFSAFQGCTSLINLYITNESILNIIEEFSFAYTNICSFYVVPTLISIGFKAFYYSGLTFLFFHPNWTSNFISQYSFSGCTSLTEINFVPAIKSISSYAFSECSSLRILNISKGIVNISSWAFKECANLEAIHIDEDSDLSNIFSFAFQDCNKLQDFIISPLHMYLSSDTGVLYNKLKTEIILYLPASPRTIFSIPDSVTIIGPYAFQSCIYLQEVQIPSSVTTIEYCAFDNCIGLSSLSIPPSITYIGVHAFRNCNGLKCNSIQYPLELITSLLQSDLPLTSLYKCPTQILIFYKSSTDVFRIQVSIILLFFTL